MLIVALPCRIATLRMPGYFVRSNAIHARLFLYQYIDWPFIVVIEEEGKTWSRETPKLSVNIEHIFSFCSASYRWEFKLEN